MIKNLKINQLSKIKGLKVIFGNISFKAKQTWKKSIRNKPWKYVAFITFGTFKYYKFIFIRDTKYN